MLSKRRFLILIFLLLILGILFIVFHKPTTTPIPTRTPEEDPYQQARLEMVQTAILAAGISDADVLRAMQTVERHRFVPPDYLDQAYANHPLPIGYGQTISQPYVVAWMTELLELRPGGKVLEIGTGSGYQAAVLAELGFVDVYSIEIVPALAENAQQLLQELGYDRVQVRQGDGYYGWLEQAPFDAIIVTAAPDHLPAPLVTQLAEGGRLVIPIGPTGWYQSLWKFVKKNGELVAYNMGGVSFVPFTGEGIEGGGPTLEQ
ncbi:MAG: protein-L-isoaspartate(D-aspartate) O-methyltransferase [Anaerolineaceae bacterium]|nr:protein-L-isoaspartate(D-aspartate) O-methyltransferase [Anaerolineaceae bacterium]MBN2677340.1 protein-L-isoaspartate(D-aspartate) O-methyltransferase [Anaerolineaceae bacterium]